MNHDYYNIKYYDKDICSNIYIILLDEISILFNNIPYRKITGPPDDFPYFKKIIELNYSSDFKEVLELIIGSVDKKSF